jgi:hypothetical protein
MVAVCPEFAPSKYMYGETEKSNLGGADDPVAKVRLWPYWFKGVHLGAAPYVHDPSCNRAEIVAAVDPEKTPVPGTQRRIC